MQQDESEVTDHELIAAVEAYESHAAHVEGQEMSVLTTVSSPTSNYLLQRRGWKTISNSEM